jgi:hypothetical protein
VEQPDFVAIVTGLAGTPTEPVDAAGKIAWRSLDTLEPPPWPDE